MAVISSLETMEQVVSSSPDLEWDGWTVVSLSKGRSGVFNPKSVRKNGEWRIAARYEVEEHGWTIPDRLLRDVAG